MKKIEYSIIIPTIDKAANLKKCLLSIERLNRPKKGWQVLVINNSKSEKTKDVVKYYKSRLRNLFYYKTSKPGLMMGRHLGCRFSKGSILCFIDDDSLVDKDWLKGIEKAFSDPKVVLVGGPVLPKYQASLPKWMSIFWQNCQYGRFNSFLSLVYFGKRVKEISPYYVFGCNFIIKKAVFLKVGGSHPDYMPENLEQFQGNGETAVAKKLINLGYKALYHPQVKIKHLVPASRMKPNYFYKRAFFQGISRSFVQIRRLNRLKSEEEKTVSKIVKKSPLALRSYYKMASFLVNIFSKKSREIAKIKAKLKKYHKAGFLFHQNEVKKNPRLLEWVLRENYLGENGNLPR